MGNDLAKPEHVSLLCVELRRQNDHYTANTIDALAAKLAEVEAELKEMTALKDIHQIKRREHLNRAEAAEAALTVTRDRCAALLRAIRDASLAMFEGRGDRAFDILDAAIAALEADT